MNDREYLNELINILHEQDNEKKLFDMAITVNGKDGQVLHTIQELTELSFELTKWLEDFNNGITDETRILNILEEMTDVKIMLSQLVLIFNFGKIELQNMHAEKLNKLKGQIDPKLRKEGNPYIL